MKVYHITEDQLRKIFDCANIIYKQTEKLARISPKGLLVKIIHDNAILLRNIPGDIIEDNRIV